MSQTEQDIEHVQISIEQSKKMIDLGESLSRLGKNPDFKRLISEGYMKDFAVDLVHLKSSPAMQSPEKQKNLDDAIIAIGQLNIYLNNIMTQASMANESIVEYEQTLSELRTEEE